MQLCTLSKGTYTPITSSEDEDTGYYQVKETTYNNKNLYIVTSDKTVSSVTLKIKENKVDYTATIFSLYGQYYRETGGLSLCSTCKAIAEKATTDKATAVESGGSTLLKIPHTYSVTTNSGQTTTYDDYEYYQYKNTSIEYVYTLPSGSVPMHVFRINGEDYNANAYVGSTPTYSNVNACLDCQSETCGHTKSSLRKYSRNVYNFILFEGCSTSRGSKVNGCGDKYFVPGYYHAQALDIIKTSATNPSNDLKLDLTIELDTSVEVQKVWDDNSNEEGNRPSSITVELYQKTASTTKTYTGKTLTLDSDNDWKGSFTGLPITYNGEAITYTVNETSVTGYTTAITGNQTTGYTITNTVETIQIPVTKIWNDDNDRDGKRPSSIKVKLYKRKSGTEDEFVDTERYYILSEDNNWTATFGTQNPLYKYEDGVLLEFKVVEETIDTSLDYEEPVIEPETIIGTPGVDTTTETIQVTNTHNVETIQIPVEKVWDDENNLDDYRPNSIKVKLYKRKSGTEDEFVDTGRYLILSENNNWTATFGIQNPLYKYEDGVLLEYKVVEAEVNQGDLSEYNDSVIEPLSIIGTAGRDNIITETIKITNTHEPHYDGYIEITGKVWLDGQAGKSNTINGTLGSEDTGLEGIKVTLKDARGRQFDVTATTTTDSNGNYIIRVNYDNSQNVYKLYEDAATVAEKLKTAYVEFEYDGLKYTTVATATTGENTSKAVEDEAVRNSLDSTHSTVTSTTQSPDNWTDKNITAITKDVISFETYTDITTRTSTETIKYCKGNGTYIRTDATNAWDDIETKNHTCDNCTGVGHSMATFDVEVLVIENVNLGLFEREQPDVAIFSDISEVQVTMNGQKYTYLYNVRSSASNHVGIQAKFQNKDTYTYRRPVNPADIAILQEEADGNEMTVTVIYEVKVANLSSTLTTTIHNITNYFDTEYTLNTSGWGVTSGTEFNKSTYNGDLNITLAPGTESSTIYLTYAVSFDAIKGLLNEDATLNNAVEIESYSTIYGADTLYAEQRTGGRTNQPYGGYDYNSHPGNAGIFINDDGRLEATNAEDDTDIAPSFVLCIDNEKYYKALSGNVWEDTDANPDDEYRVGDGKKADTDKNIANVKVELYRVKENGTFELAKLYSVNRETGEVNSIDAIAYSDANGNYSLGDGTYGVATDKYQYVMKFTYGEGIDGLKTSTIDNITVNARNYKSTIISEENPNVYNLFKGTSADDEWYLNISKGYSIAVDNIEERTKISDLQYSNFGEAIYISAWSKPFTMQLEFNASEEKESSVEEDGNTIFGNNLDVFDFGVIERAREDLYVQKTVDYIKVTLANGQALTEGNPNTQDLNYVKAMGFNSTINNGTSARNALDKQLVIEMDAELIQGAQLETKYRIEVTNNSERDYDYYLGDINAAFDASQVRTEFYYFGTNNEASPEIRGSIEYLVDYVEADIAYTWENPSDWTKVTAIDLKNQGLISSATCDYVANGYTAYATTKYSDLAPGETRTDYATASKLLANENENVYENHLEILKIDAKIARTIKGKDSAGTPVTKEYKPGNYVPSLASRQVNTDVNNEQAGLHEQDDDRVKIIITPPTGITTYILTYILVVFGGLIVISMGILFIKKKVLIK